MSLAHDPTRVSTYLGALLGDDGHGGPTNISSSHTTDLEFPVTHLGLFFGLSKRSKCSGSLRRWTANLYAMGDERHDEGMMVTPIVRRMDEE